MNNDIFKDKLIRQELGECLHDPVYFLTKYAKFCHPCKGAIPFQPYVHQEKLIQSYKDNRFNIVHGARQVGIQMTGAMYILWYAMFNSDKRIVIASHALRNGRELLDRIRLTYEFLPEFCKVDIKKNLKGSIEFGNGSTIRVVSTDQDSIRGYSVDLIWLDSFGHWEDYKQSVFFEKMRTGSTNNSSVIITSTAVSRGGMFKTIFEQARENKNDFIAHHIAWNAIKRPHGFKDDIIKYQGEEAWKIEYECSAMIKEDYNGTRKEYKPQET